MGRGSEVLAYSKQRRGIRKFYEKKKTLKETQYFSWGNGFSGAEGGGGGDSGGGGGTRGGGGG